MPQPLTHPFPLRLTTSERSNLDRVYEVLSSKRTDLMHGRTTRTDVARMALDRGLETLLHDLAPEAVPSFQAPASLPHDSAWMTEGARIASSLIPPYDWGDVDPGKAGDPILVVEGRGAFVVK